MFGILAVRVHFHSVRPLATPERGSPIRGITYKGSRQRARESSCTATHDHLVITRHSMARHLRRSRAVSVTASRYDHSQVKVNVKIDENLYSASS